MKIRQGQRKPLHASSSLASSTDSGPIGIGSPSKIDFILQTAIETGQEIFARPGKILACLEAAGLAGSELMHDAAHHSTPSSSISTYHGTNAPEEIAVCNIVPIRPAHHQT